MNTNPFTFGSPIRDRQRFFNRKAVIQRIMNRLRSMQDSSIIGERRIGKTSLLYHLQEADVIQEHGLDPEQYLLIYFDFGGAGQLTPTRFWQRLLQSLSEKVSDEVLCAQIDRLRGMGEIDPFDIEDLFLEVSDRGLRVVFLLDEFETVTQSTRLDADFFSHLRSLATGRYIGLIFVTCSRQKLSELSHAGIVGSPFFNIFETFFLKPFRPERAQEMMERLLSGTGVTFDPQEQAYLMTLSGQHPFFLQLAASYLFDAYAVQELTGKKLRPARLERVEHDFLTQAEPHFAHYWQQSTDREKILLTALSVLKYSGSGVDAPDKGTMQNAYREADIASSVLEDRGLVLLQEAGGYRVFSPAYERWILQELTWPADSRRDYAVWLEQNEPYYGGSLQPLYDRAEDVTTMVNPRYWNLLTEWLSKSNNPVEMVDLLKEAAKPAKDHPVWLAFVEE